MGQKARHREHAQQKEDQIKGDVSPAQRGGLPHADGQPAVAVAKEHAHPQQQRRPRGVGSGEEQKLRQAQAGQGE